MAWTDADPELRRSRADLLAEVLRRGGRIRRRRRTATALAGALALVVPVTALVSVASGGDPGVSVSASAPGAPSGGNALPATGAEGSADPTEAVTTTVAPTATAPGPPVPILAPEPRPAASILPPVATATTKPGEAGNPVVRVSPPTVPEDGTGSSSSPPMATVTSVPGSPPAAEAPLGACPVAQVRVTVTVDKSTYAPGETVRWSSTLENRSGTTCLVSGRAFFHVEDTAGRTVGAFAHTADFQLPVKAEPGKTFTSGFNWDQRDCSGSACVQVPGGGYVVVAEWTEAGPYVGRGSFQIRS